MRRLNAALYGILLGGGAVYFAFQFHLVRAEEGFLVIPKNNSAMIDPYVDVREWTVADWKTHPELIQSLVEHGRSDLVLSEASNGLFRGWWKKLGSAALENEGTKTE